MCARVPRDRFLPLPQAVARAGAPRRVGVEIEFAALTETQVAALVTRRYGGMARQAGPYELRVEGSALGDMQIYLDTAFRKGKANLLCDYGLRLGREVIPVEIVTDPLPANLLPEIDGLREALRRAGALGSGGGWLFGFGLHFNVEVAASRVQGLRSVLTAFALMEDWLRLAHPIDPSRRLLPFVDPYPRRFVRQLLRLPAEAGRDDLVDLYLRLTPTRNRSLDMLPLFRHLDAARLLRALPHAAQISPRPAWHYRLPDSRVDEADWTVAFEWNRWVLVERTAEDADLMARLAEAWLACDRDGLARRDWCAEVEGLLTESDALREPA